MLRSGRATGPAVRRLGVIALAVAAATLIAACGGSGRHRPAAARVTPVTLLDQTVGAARTVDSGQIDLTLDVALRGVKQLGAKPITLEISGPFARASHGSVSTALAIALTAAQSHVAAGLDIVRGVTYLGLGGQFYELGGGHGTKPGEGSTGVTGATGPLGAPGLNLSSWLISPRLVGTAEVGGVETEHLHASVDVPKALQDLYARLSPELGDSGASGASGATGGPGVTGDSGATGDSVATGDSGATGVSGASFSLDAVLPLLESAINSATVDIYTGVSDHVVRRAHLAVAFTVPAIAAGALGGATGGRLDLDATLTDVGKPQSIVAPPDAQPASKLLNGVLALESQFGSLAPLVKGFGSMLPVALGVPGVTGG